VRVYSTGREEGFIPFSHAVCKKVSCDVDWIGGLEDTVLKCVI
jgi:hypothetical protein